MFKGFLSGLEEIQKNKQPKLLRSQWQSRNFTNRSGGWDFDPRLGPPLRRETRTLQGTCCQGGERCYSEIKIPYSAGFCFSGDLLFLAELRRPFVFCFFFSRLFKQIPVSIIMVTWTDRT